MKKKQLIRLTEGDLHRIIKESVNKILKEEFQITLSNSGKEGLQNMMNSVAAVNELKSKGETQIVIPTHNDNAIHATLYQSENGGIRVESNVIQDEFPSINHAIQALKKCAE